MNTGVFCNFEKGSESIAEQVEPTANQVENNNNNATGAMSAEDMQLKMQELQRRCEAAEAEAARAREAARQTEEAADSDFGMSLHGEFRGPSFHGTPGANTGVFSQEPVFNYTGNLDLNRPNLSRQEESTPKDSSVLRGNDSSDSECEYA